MDEKAAAHAKNILRKELKARRKSRAYDPEDASALNVHLAELCLTTGANRIACYLSFDEEPDTELFIDWALENKIEVLLPVCKPDGNLDWVQFDGNTQPGLFGFAEPVGSPQAPRNIDLVIIPALAVDARGMRLGKGKGYYDRGLLMFEPLPPVIAVVFDEELVEQIPEEGHDHPVDAAISPSGIRIFTDRLK